MGIVVFEREVLDLEGVDVADLRIDPHGGEWMDLAGELELGLLEVIRVEVQVAEGVHEVAWFVAEDLRNHHGEDCVARDIEGDAEKEICAALVELAGETGPFAPGIMDIELKEEVAGREGHLIDLAHVPGRDDVAARVRLVLEIVEEAGDLIDGLAVLGLPGPPLLAVNGAEVAVLIGPLVPDANLVVLEVADVGVAHQEPEELVNDGAEVELFGGQAGKALAEIVARLAAKNRTSAGAGAVGALFAVFKDIAEQIQVLPHGFLVTANGAKDAKIRLGISVDNLD